MKKTKFTEQQIAFALKQAEGVANVAEVCRKMGISEATFYNRKKKFGALGISELRRLRQLEVVEESYKLDTNPTVKDFIALIKKRIFLLIFKNLFAWIYNESGLDFYLSPFFIVY